MRIFTFLNFTLGLVFVQTGKPAPKSRHDHTRQPTFVLLMLQVSSGKQPRHLRNCGGHWGDRCENLSSSNSAILKGSCISGGEAGTAGAKERPNEMMPLGLFHLPVEPEPRAVPLSVKPSCVGLLHHRRAGATNTCESWRVSCSGKDKMSQRNGHGGIFQLLQLFVMGSAGGSCAERDDKTRVHWTHTKFGKG